MGPGFGEDIPEPEGFVARSGDDRFAIWRHGQVEDSKTMTGQLGDLTQARVFPHQDLVLRIPMGRYLSRIKVVRNAVLAMTSPGFYSYANVEIKGDISI